MTTTTTRARWAVAAAALLLAPALLTACSSSGKPESSPTPKSNGVSTLFSCMRDKGYDMPDPAPGERGSSISAPDGVDPDQYDADFQSCAGKVEGAGQGTRGKPAKGAAEAFKKTVECVREHGFEDFPDDMDAAAKYKPSDETAFDDALKSCPADASVTVGQ